MHWLGTCTAQSFNRRHERSGHLYQGRFGSRLVEDDAYLLELARYLPLNPVRAGLCNTPGGWPWSSYAATAGLRATPCFLEAGALLETSGLGRCIVAWVADGRTRNALWTSTEFRDLATPAARDLLPDDSRPSDRSCPLPSRLQQGRHRTTPRREPLADRAAPRSSDAWGQGRARPGSDPHCAGQTPSARARPRSSAIG